MAASELQKAVEKLIQREPGWRRFVPAPAVGERPGGRSSGRPSAASGQAGDLVETNYALREYWPQYNLETTDGMFAIVFEDVKTVVFEDGRKLQLAQRPPA